MKPHPDKAVLEQIFPSIRKYQELASKHGIGDNVFRVGRPDQHGRKPDEFIGVLLIHLGVRRINHHD